MRVSINMSIIRGFMTRLNSGRQIKLKYRIILVNIISLLISLIVSYLYFITSIKKFHDKHDLIEIDGMTFWSYNWIGLIIVGISFVISCVIIITFSCRFSNRLSSFQDLMHKVVLGEYENLQVIDGFDEISEMYRDLNTMISSIQRLISKVYEEQMQKEKLYSRQKDVEFKMLASQINPHFLYNTLETIRMKARANKQTEIEELVKMLAKILRRNIQVGDKLVTLKSELELVDYYLKIQQYRFGERMSYNIDVRCNIDSLKIMPLIIQPIVENAFVHGLESKEGKGKIDVVVELKERLIIQVIDNGKGMTETKLNEIIKSFNDYNRLDSNHIGLSNVNQRIKLLYGDEYGLDIESTVGEGTTVRIELPKDITR